MNRLKQTGAKRTDQSRNPCRASSMYATVRFGQESRTLSIIGITSPWPARPCARSPAPRDYRFPSSPHPSPRWERLVATKSESKDLITYHEDPET